MLKLTLALLLPAVAAAVGPTTVAQAKITNGAQQLATGKITIVATTPFLAADGSWVDTTSLTVPVINGAFSVQLEPNDTATPSGGSYFVQWQLDGAKARTEYWVVATSGSALSLASVRVNTAPTVSLTFTVSQLLSGGAVTGQGICWTGTTWAPGECGWLSNTVSCSSSPTYDFSLGNIQVLNLSCNVTSGSVLNVPPGPVVFRICNQGAFSFSWPAAVTGGVDPTQQAVGKCAVEWFQSQDGVHLQPIGLGVINQ